MFEVGRIYKRSDIHAQHGGQQQSGISTPKDRPYILLFTGTGEPYGYHDGWYENRIFLYSGISHAGDMAFTGGNKAIRGHARDGKDLHLFEQAGPGRVRYVGPFVCCSWHFRQAKDASGKPRRAIIFHLVPLEEVEAPVLVTPGAPAQLPLDLKPVDELRRKAFASASEAEEASPKKARRLYYERSAALRAYVLRRARGVCEACGKSAPFSRRDGTAYLEPHHIRRYSDGGPDHPRWVGAVCPNCHREIHHGVNGERLNRELDQRLGAIERDEN